MAGTVAVVDPAVRRDTAIRVSADAPLADCAAYAAGHRDASAYHHPAWLDVIRRGFGHETRYLAARSGDTIVGVLPLVLFDSRLFGRFGVSVPFVNYGGIVCDTPEAGRALVDAAIAETRAVGGKHLELRHTSQFDPTFPSRRHKVAMKLVLQPTPEQQWDAIDRKIRNQIRKAEKSGLEISIGGGELVDDFYVVFARNMRDLGTPVYSKRFFAEVLATFPGSSRVLVARVAGVAAAASIVHAHRDEIEVPWASAVREYNALCANMFLYWHMLKFACEQGFRVFDFGRSTPGEGTFKFKEQWGARPTELVWEYWLASGGPLPDLSPRNPKFAALVGTWKRLPLWVASRLGPHIVRHIP